MPALGRLAGQRHVGVERVRDVLVPRGVRRRRRLERAGRAAAQAKDGELFLVNAYIPEYTQASRFNHEPRRVRKLLVHKREAAKLAAAIQREGMTLIPL